MVILHKEISHSIYGVANQSKVLSRNEDHVLSETSAFVQAQVELTLCLQQRMLLEPLLQVWLLPGKCAAQLSSFRALLMRFDAHLTKPGDFSG